MTPSMLRMRLREDGRLRTRWAAYIDPADGKAMRAELLAAIASTGAEDPTAALPRFELQWQGQSGPWRSFRAGA